MARDLLTGSVSGNDTDHDLLVKAAYALQALAGTGDAGGAVQYTPQTARLTAADVVFISTTTLGTVLQLTGLTAGATYWTEIGTRVQDDQTIGNAKVQCGEAVGGGCAMAWDEYASSASDQPATWNNSTSPSFSTSGIAAKLAAASGTVLNFQWRGFCVADGSGRITLKGAQHASHADAVTFLATGSTDADGVPGNTFIRAQKV